MTEDIATKQLLKTVSGEFEIESIHFLNLRDSGLSDLGCLGECNSLERLDLSRNDISRLYKLSGLTQLSSLNLSANRITSLEGLQSLENLKCINLAGNLLGGFDCLVYLTGLEKLEELRLKDPVSGLSNPVCLHVNYVEEIEKRFPKLLVLDGERLKGKGSDLYQMCRQIDRSLEKESNAGDGRSTDVMSEIGRPWVSPDYWTARSDPFQQTPLHDAEQQLTDLLAGCKRLVEKSDERLQCLQQGSNQSPYVENL